jgi:DNA-binding response OmpR family regulator
MKILVTEDDRKVAGFLQRALSEEGYTVDLCTSGAEAVTQARAGLYNLVVLDWMIPDLDGLEVCRQLRRGGSAVPILMLTARGELQERVLAFNAGADDYIVKPFEVEEFIVRVAAILRRSVGLLRFRLGALEIDRESRNALLDGKRLELTTRENALLLHLAYRAGQVVTRSELLLRVWSTQFDSGSNVVEVHMSRLRDKLGKHAWMLETVRGRGYRLRERNEL